MIRPHHRIHRTATAILLFGVAASSPVLAAPVRTECSSPPAGTVFCEDFEGTNPKSHFDDYDGNPDSENPVMVEPGPNGDSSNKSVRFRAPAGERGGADLLKMLPTGYDKLYARWYIKFESGFDFAAPMHGGGLAAGDRNLLGRSGIRPNGNEYASFIIDHNKQANPYSYSYYRGMYQDCSDPNGGACWGDSLPCVYDSGGFYCTKPEHRPTKALPTFNAKQWHCVEELLDLGTPNTTGQNPNGRLAIWLDGTLVSDISNLWIRTTSNLKITMLWLNLFHHDGTHSTAGEFIDNVVVSTQPIGCSAAGIVTTPPTEPSGLQVIETK
ncbi:MAG: hypothetical protein E6R14_12675 [Thermomicrobiales bacterium]|nr:MAG: hypothetical protein E6R14_12675 [Thermomicrobiales bacterium]